MKLTIGIPVFNAEGTLRRCLDSVLSQKGIGDFEVVCVDDGSTDTSRDILKAYEDLYSNVRIVNQKKQGAFSARHRVIMAARGEWIGFVDSDDEVKPSMYCRMLRRACESDGAEVIVCAFEKTDECGKPLATQMDCYGCAEYDFSAHPDERGILLNVNPAYWNKIFRTDVARRAIVLDSPPKIMEDLVFWASILPFVSRVAFVPDALYRYRDASGSSTKRIGRKEMDDAARALGELSAFLRGLGDAACGCYMADLTRALMYVHYGVGFTLNYNAFLTGEGISDVWKDSFRFLRSAFGEMAGNRYMRLHYVVKHRQLLKLYVAVRLYRWKIWPLVVRLYHAFTKAIKKDLKW